jgi:hypothetical protein
MKWEIKAKRIGKRAKSRRQKRMMTKLERLKPNRQRIRKILL